MTSKRLRVLTVITRLELGGAQRVALHTAATLDRSRFEAGLAWGPGDVLDDDARAIDGLTTFEIDALVRPVAPVRDLRALASSALSQPVGRRVRGPHGPGRAGVDSALSALRATGW